MFECAAGVRCHVASPGKGLWVSTRARLLNLLSEGFGWGAQALLITGPSAWTLALYAQNPCAPLSATNVTGARCYSPQTRVLLHAKPGSRGGVCGCCKIEAGGGARYQKIESWRGGGMDATRGHWTLIPDTVGVPNAANLKMRWGMDAKT